VVALRSAGRHSSISGVFRLIVSALWPREYDNVQSYSMRNQVSSAKGVHCNIRIVQKLFKPVGALQCSSFGRDSKHLLLMAWTCGSYSQKHVRGRTDTWTHPFLCAHLKPQSSAQCFTGAKASMQVPCNAPPLVEIPNTSS
jgi:hypothetical protein